MSNVTRDQIESATTKGLHDLYLQMTGKPTTNRNTKALRSRLLGLFATGSYLAEQTRCETSGHTIAPPSAIEPASAKPVAKSPRLNKIAERVGKRAVAASARLTKAAKPSKPKMMKKSMRQDRIDAGKATAPPKKTPKTPRADKGIDRKPKGVKPQRRSHHESNTRKVLAELTEGQELKHDFRGGLTVKATVITPPDVNGEGGKFRHEKKNYTNLRDIQREVCDTDYNVLLFWGLAPWPKHRKQGDK